MQNVFILWCLSWIKKNANKLSRVCSIDLKSNSAVFSDFTNDTDISTNFTFSLLLYAIKWHKKTLNTKILLKSYLWPFFLDFSEIFSDFEPTDTSGMVYICIETELKSS